MKTGKGLRRLESLRHQLLAALCLLHFLSKFTLLFLASVPPWS